MRDRRTAIRNQRVLGVSIITMLVFAILASVLLSSMKAQARPAEASYKYYTSVRVEKGDTLWQIAETYITDDYRSLNDYMDEICSINHIANDDIHAGQYLTIPYYSADYLD